MPLRQSLFLPVLAAILSASMLSNLAARANAQNSEKYASIVIDVETDQVLHARHADALRYPASLTKVMTLYMVFDALKAGELSLHERLPVSYKASRQPPSKLGLKPGHSITVDQAVRALIAKSANDVAVVVAERLGASEERFAALMTVKAATLGMHSTRFFNASGLPDARQVSTARDLSRLAEAMIDDHPEYYAYFSTPSFYWNGRTYKNHNKLLADVPGVDGLKTGYTRASGYNLMTSATRDGQRVIAVMLGGRSARVRNAHVEDLVETAFAALGPSESPTLRAKLSF
ncbi:MAG: D-alanyl-D-alanine carboxypeptidase family protein, partial [Pseudomonadota bacterium]